MSAYPYESVTNSVSTLGQGNPTSSSSPYNYFTWPDTSTACSANIHHFDCIHESTCQCGKVMRRILTDQLPEGL